MKATALLLLLAFPAWANDAPRKLNAFPVSAGYVVAEPAWIYTEEGKAKVDAELQRRAEEMAAGAAREASLRDSLKKMEQQPALTVRGVVVVALLGMAVGAVATAAICLSVRR